MHRTFPLRSDIRGPVRPAIRARAGQKRSNLQTDSPQQLMQAHRDPGALPKISETLWYVASLGGYWIALLSFSAVAWPGSARGEASVVRTSPVE